MEVLRQNFVGCVPVAAEAEERDRTDANTRVRHRVVEPYNMIVHALRGIANLQLERDVHSDTVARRRQRRIPITGLMTPLDRSGLVP